MLDILHALEQVSKAKAVKAIVPDRVERDRPIEEIKAGLAAKAVPQLEPFSGGHEESAPYFRYFRNDLEGMRYDPCFDQDIQVGSGVA